MSNLPYIPIKTVHIYLFLTALSSALMVYNATPISLRHLKALNKTIVAFSLFISSEIAAIENDMCGQ